MASVRKVDDPQEETPHEANANGTAQPQPEPDAGANGVTQKNGAAKLDEQAQTPQVIQPPIPLAPQIGDDPRGVPLIPTPITPQQPAARKKRRGYRALFRNPLFLRLWIAQMISQTIMNAANYGLIVLVAVVSQSTTATSGAFVAFSLPAALMGAPAGVLVDRLDRRMVLWVSNALRAIGALIFVFSLLIDPAALWPVYTLTFFIALVGQFFGPAEGAAIPRLVGKSELMNALALFNITFTLAQVAGLILLGPLVLLLAPTIHLGKITILPVAILFILIAVLYVGCALLILSIPKERLDAPALASVSDGQTIIQRKQHPLRLRVIWSGIAEMARFIWNDAILHISVWQLTLAGLILSIVALLAPRFVQEFFHAPPALAALVFLPAGLGVLLGAAMTPYIARRLRYTRTITIGVITLSVSAGFMTFIRWLAPLLDPRGWWHDAPYLAVVMGLTFLIGVALDFINVPAQTRMQEHAPDEIKGRVLSAQTMLLNLVTVVLAPAFGVAADRFGLSGAFNILASSVLILGLLSVYLSVRASRARAAKTQQVNQP